MSDESSKNRRRRRRPRGASKSKAKARAKENKAPAPAKSAPSRRSRGRKKGGRSKERKPAPPGLTVQQHQEPGVSPINKDIFIYTYTLRPRSLLEGYEAGPNVTDKMEFEESTRFTFND